LASNPAMLAIPDIRMVRDKVDIIAGRITNHFTGARANRKDIAQSIA